MATAPELVPPPLVTPRPGPAAVDRCISISLGFKSSSLELWPSEEPERSEPDDFPIVKLTWSRQSNAVYTLGSGQQLAHFDGKYIEEAGARMRSAAALLSSPDYATAFGRCRLTDSAGSSAMIEKRCGLTCDDRQIARSAAAPLQLLRTQVMNAILISFSKN